jgi:DNA modification methylase
MEARKIIPPEPYYQDDLVTIYHGDNREIVPLLGVFDLLLTDPPYGLNENQQRNESRGKPAGSRNPSRKPTMIFAKDYGSFDWDKGAPEPWLIEMCRAHCARQIIFGGNYFNLPPAKCWLVWDKDNSGDFADCELAWTNLDKAVRKFTWRWNGMLQEDMKNKENRTHPTQKPLALMHWCLSLINEPQSVLDPFMGSGTTLLAAKQKGIKAVGIDINEKYCADAADRLRQRTIFET